MLLIFDWDGTLLDSADKIICCMQAAAREVGVEPREAAAVRNIIGLGLPEAIRALYPGVDMDCREQIRRAYADHYIKADQHPCAFFPGVVDTLAHLRERGHALGVATGKSRRGLDRVLEQVGLQGFFDITRCADETESKPSPLMLQEILGALDVLAEDAVMVGDTEYDMAMARAAGVAPIAVDYGAHEIERLLAYEPVLRLSEFAELGAWVEAQSRGS